MSSPATAPTAAPAAGGLRRYRRHFHHLRPARWHLIGGVLAGLVFAISTGAGLPAVMNYLLPIFFNEQEKIEPRVVEIAIWLFGQENYVRSLLITACIGLPLVFLVRGVASFLNRYWVNQAGFVVLEGVRLQAYTRLLGLPLAFFSRNPAGDLNARLMADTEKIRSVVVAVSSDVITQPLTLLSALGYLTYHSFDNRSVLFALIAMVSVPLCIIPIRMAARKLVRRSRELAQKGGELSSVSIETLQSPLEIQAYNLQERQRDRFVVRIREILRLSLKTIKYQAAVTPAIEFISVCGFVAALYFGTKNGLTFHAFVSLATALYLSYAPVKKLSALHATIKIGEASLDRLEYVLDAPDTVPQPLVARSVPAGPLALAFEDVRFAYAPRSGDSPAPGSTPPAALDGVSLHAAPGETIALVGASGAGKSTFVTLIPRFYDPGSGRITLGGVDLRELDKSALRECVAVVPQQPLLFNASFAENIRMGRLSATDAEVEQAARRAHAHDFITSQTRGYATLVGERGGALSGGQRQRIAIARAFLKNAPILILDEATSALDSESEAAIQEALRELVKGRLTFMIAHRFSSIRHATRILVFEKGRIVADGPHEKLHASNSLYRELHDRQLLGAS